MRTTEVSVSIELDEIEDEMKQYVQENYRPEEVFPTRELEEWAEENGYEKE